MNLLWLFKVNKSKSMKVVYKFINSTKVFKNLSNSIKVNLHKIKKKKPVNIYESPNPKVDNIIGTRGFPTNDIRAWFNLNHVGGCQTKWCGGNFFLKLMKNIKQNLKNVYKLSKFYEKKK